MARPRIFISSTFYDLKHIRSSLENFIETLGYEPVLSEKGNIAYNSEIPLDESCYRDAKTCDVFVLIIGGRYGSAASDQEVSLPKSFYDRYESITKKEYEATVDRDIPTYILIDRSVYADYETFKLNRDSKETNYAHADSINIFLLIDEILNQPRNNPVHQFDRHNEIESWLRKQWAGLFKEMISSRLDKKQIATLSGEVAELSNISTTLKNYLEEIVSRVSEKEAPEIIKAEEQRLIESRQLEEFRKTDFVHYYVNSYEVPLEQMHRIFVEAKSINNLADMINAFLPAVFRNPTIAKIWQSEIPDVYSDIQIARNILGLPELEFEPEKKTKAKPKKVAKAKKKPRKSAHKK